MRTLGACLGALLVAACGGGGESGGAAASDAAKTDSATDAGGDATADATPDTAREASPDVATDASPDATLDGAGDALPDGVADTATDVATGDGPPIDPLSYTELYVSPSGSDSASGADLAHPLLTLSKAWSLIPADLSAEAQGYRVNLMPGEIPCGPSDPSTCEGYFGPRYGTATAPIVLRSIDASGNYSPGASLLRGGGEFVDVRHLTIRGVVMRAGNGYPTNTSGNNVLHIAAGDAIVLEDLTLTGTRANYQIQEVLKVNQVHDIRVEHCDISGAFQVPVDFMAVQDGQLRHNHIFDADSWCMYLKGGTSNVNVEGNVLGDVDPARSCSRGFSAGEGNGLEYMVSPWLHYGAYDLKFVNNVVQNADSIGLGVQGGYNILIAHNTFYKVGKDSHAFIFTFGARVCDGNLAACTTRHDAGGWGITTSGDTGSWIPNRNVYFYDNVLYNPPGYQSQWQHFVISGPVSPPAGSNVPDPAVTDQNLRIRGNFIANGTGNLTLIGSFTSVNGCDASNVTCNPAQILADNSVNQATPEFVDAAAGDFRPLPGGSLLAATTYTIPDFPGGDAPTAPAVPDLSLGNSVPVDKAGRPRSTPDVVGAFTAP